MKKKEDYALDVKFADLKDLFKEIQLLKKYLQTYGKTEYFI